MLASKAGIVDVQSTASFVLTTRGAGPLIQVRVANTFVSRFVGLLNRSTLGANEGLLLAPGGSIHTLWMHFAIDVIFLDERWEVLRVVAQVPPWRWVYAPRRTRFVLELAAGGSHAAALETGVTLQRCRQHPTVHYGGRT